MPDPEDMVELTGRPAAPGEAEQEPSPNGRGYLRLWFRCAGQYARAYANAAGTGYNGRCPKCGQTIRFRIGPGGTSERFFEVSC